MKPKAAISWSGGKDSCAALRRARAEFDVVAAITMFDEAMARSRSHGLRPEIVAAQSRRLGLRQIVGRCSWADYNEAFAAVLGEAAADGITHVVFGDIVFPEHRRWAEEMCGRTRLTAVEPLFGCSTTDLFRDWIASGGEALIVTVRAEHLGPEWLGRPLAEDMLADFVRLGVDPCGERGEYHTVVTRTPIFDSPLCLDCGDCVQRSGCFAIDVTLSGGEAAAS